MTKPTKQEVTKWLASLSACEGSYPPSEERVLAQAAIDLLKAIPEPEPEWGPWIGWNGGDCPVEHGVIVEVVDVPTGSLTTSQPESLDWAAAENYPIIAYRVKNTPQKLEFFWRPKDDHMMLYASKKYAVNEMKGAGFDADHVEKVEVRVIK
jgi:hypothetical protein